MIGTFKYDIFLATCTTFYKSCDMFTHLWPGPRHGCDSVWRELEAFDGRQVRGGIGLASSPPCLLGSFARSLTRQLRRKLGGHPLKRTVVGIRSTPSGCHKMPVQSLVSIVISVWVRSSRAFDVKVLSCRNTLNVLAEEYTDPEKGL